MQRLLDSYSENFDVKISVNQDFIPLGLRAVADELQNDLIRITEVKHSQ